MARSATSVLPCSSCRQHRYWAEARETNSSSRRANEHVLVRVVRDGKDNTLQTIECRVGLFEPSISIYRAS